MTTMQSPNEVEVSTPANVIPVKASDLYDLISGALVAAGTDKHLPVLNSVNLTCESGTLTATATDRYRLVIGKLPLGDENLKFHRSILIRANECNGIVKACKDLIALKAGNEIVSLMLEGDKLTFLTRLTSQWIEPLENTFPPTKSIIDGLTPTAVQTFSVNPDLLATFSKIPHAKGDPITFTFNGERKPLISTHSHNGIEWTALLMPMRVI